MYRLRHARKTCNKENMQDIFNRCMLTSDPVILAFFEKELLKKRPKKRPITEGIRNLMADPKDIPHYMDIDDDELMEEDSSDDSADDFFESESESEIESESEQDSDVEE